MFSELATMFGRGFCRFLSVLPLCVTFYGGNSLADATSNVDVDLGVNVPLYCSADFFDAGVNTQNNLGAFIDTDASLIDAGTQQIYNQVVTCNARTSVTISSRNSGLLSSATGAFTVDDGDNVFAGRRSAGGAQNEWYMDYRVNWSWAGSTDVEAVTTAQGLPPNINADGLGPISGSFTIGVDLVTGTNNQQPGSIAVEGSYSDVIEVVVESENL